MRKKRAEREKEEPGGEARERGRAQHLQISKDARGIGTGWFLPSVLMSAP